MQELRFAIPALRATPIVSIVTLLSLALGIGANTATLPAVVSPQPAAQFITGAFETHPLVAFNEPGHGASGTKEFLASLIRYPGFAGTVNDIVIECGNARYQASADRYFDGSVGHDELRQIWENTTIVSGVWQLPMYEEILADISAFNMTLPEKQRICAPVGTVSPFRQLIAREPSTRRGILGIWRSRHFRPLALTSSHQTRSSNTFRPSGIISQSILKTYRCPNGIAR